MQLKISRNNKGCKTFLLIINSNLIIVPFDEIRFQHIFSKLYNRIFVMEEYKYLPPKYSYSLKDLATDYGVFERMELASVISGSTNLSMTTASGFNVGFNSDPPLREKDFNFPLSPIKETRGSSNQPISKSKFNTSPNNNSFSSKNPTITN